MGWDGPGGTLGSRGPDWILSPAESLFQHTCTRRSLIPPSTLRARRSLNLLTWLSSSHRLALFPLSHGNYALPAACWALHTVAFPLRESPLALMVLTLATSGPVVVDGESFLDALFASAGQG